MAQSLCVFGYPGSACRFSVQEQVGIRTQRGYIIREFPHTTDAVSTSAPKPYFFVAFPWVETSTGPGYYSRSTFTRLARR